MIIHLESANDPRVSDYVSLTDVQLRKAKEPAEGLYIAESPKVVRRALAAGHSPRSFFVSEKRLPEVQDVLDAHPGIPAYVGTAAMLEDITGINLHRGAMASMHRPAPVPVEALLVGARRVAVLENISDHTNIGAIFRSAAALGIDAVLISPSCGDPLYRRSIRVSMGTVFAIPWARLENLPAGLELLHGAGFATAALALEEDSLTIHELAARNEDKLALILGSEGYGLSRETLDTAQNTVMIPMYAGVDSLNVAAASAVAFFATDPRR
ncbi:tRNA G18 (ribose-2'-O)-methylase SpoU [Arthrobacter stackebrandtii]|uniref:tRNA G18 (Ribose-2'-O)-methylase SpoU n=1 Tax=Arthrobacter stackebrandtii TaxID=272161 RepID=A0ABS4Z0K2_9MICC|nr:RNA methyltransferase [Arthrobacter stackebrandtii]MBP2414596.1 tRNA G18 (ribose-2'-O)-methylase SpoU [Arthrobacter stackebrandtii]PYH01701.1 rRNA methyltransferase [Arthrobacter stackebrandtii]